MRRFTPVELLTTTQSQFNALCPADQSAFSSQLVDLWADQTADDKRLDRDYDLIGSYRRYELGE